MRVVTLQSTAWLNTKVEIKTERAVITQTLQPHQTNLTRGLRLKTPKSRVSAILTRNLI